MSKLSAKQRITEYVQSILTHPTTEMRNAFRALPPQHRWMLFALLDCEKWDREPLRRLQQTYERICPSRAVGPFYRTYTELTEAFLRLSESKIGWIHPTCRDLAISELADAHEDRRHFLRHCSSLGLSTALAVGAGPTGAIDFPLIVSDHDWSLVRQRACELNSTEVLGLISGLFGMISWRWQGTIKTPPTELVAIGSDALVACIKNSRDDHVISQSDLKLILRARRHFRPFTALPGVARALRVSLENVSGILESNDLLDAADTVKEFGSFCETVLETEPRLLAALPSTASFKDFESACRAAMNTVAKDGRRDLTDEDELPLDDLESLATNYDRLLDGIREIQDQFKSIPGSNLTLGRLEAQIAEVNDALEAEVKRRQPPPKTKKRPATSEWQSYEERQRADLKQIQAVFRDL